jgi:ParB family chromosome partitioning protein
MIPLDQLVEDADNPRQENYADADDDLRASLAADGQLNDLIVVKQPGTDKQKVIAGNRRLRMMRLLGWTEARCREIEADELIVKKVKLLDNLHRVGPCDIDTALYVTSLMAEYGWSQKRVARELSLDQCVVSRWVTMANKLAPDLRTSGLPGRVLYLLASKVKTLEEQRAWAVKVKSERLTIQQLTALLSDKKTQAKKTTLKARGAKIIIHGVSSKQELLDVLAEALAQLKRQ